MENLTNPTDPSRPGNARGGWAHRRRTLLVAGGLTLAAAVAAPLVAVAVSGSPRAGVVSTSSATGTTLRPALEFTTVPEATTVPSPTTVAQPPPTNATAPVPKVAPTTVAAPPTTALACRNSYNPACGPFRWDPSPSRTGSPTVSIKTSSNPTAGTPVTFTVSVSDPDTSVFACGQVVYGDGYGSGCSAGSAACPTRYGPWDPPATRADSASTTYTHTFDKPGTYTISVEYPVGGPCYDPYQSQATGSITISVAAAQATSSANPG